jgi:hypothetical protein
MLTVLLRHVHTLELFGGYALAPKLICGAITCNAPLPHTPAHLDPPLSIFMSGSSLPAQSSAQQQPNSVIDSSFTLYS